MSTIFKHCCLAAIGLSSLLALSACDGDVVPVAENGCIWVDDSIPAQFLYAEFYPPKADCDPCFENQCWESGTPIVGVYNLLYNITQGLYSQDFVMTWVTSIDTKKCDNSDLDENSQRIHFYPNNYIQLLSANDVIATSPVVHNSCGFSLDDYKHQLIIQIPDAYNECTGTVGTITWTHMWIGDENAPFVDPNWQFECPSDGLHSSFTPQYGQDRHIYVYYEFRDIK